MTKRRDQPVSDLRITTHGLRVLSVMREQNVKIHFDQDVCVILTEPNRPISHKCVVSLRSQRLIRPRDNDPAVYVLTNRAIEALDNDPRTRSK